MQLTLPFRLLKGEGGKSAYSVQQIDTGVEMSC